MPIESSRLYSGNPQTTTLQRLFSEPQDWATMIDLLFLERWEICPLPGSAAALRVSQIRRANPELVAAIRQELAHNKPAKSTS